MWGCIKIFVNKVMLGFTEIFLGTKFNSHTKFFSPFYMSQNSLYGSTSSRKNWIYNLLHAIFTIITKTQNINITDD